MASKDVMIDIETLSTHPSEALILSIGAVPFESNDSGVICGPPLIVVPDMKEQILLGRRIDRKTQQWWSRQPAMATDHWLHPSQLVDVKSALGLLDMFIREGMGFKRVWANGIVFDLGNLEHIYRSMGMETPWDYNAARDARTVYDEQICATQPPRVTGNAQPKQDFGPHHPLFDCRVQISRLWDHGYRTEQEPPQAQAVPTPPPMEPARMVEGS